MVMEVFLVGFGMIGPIGELAIFPQTATPVSVGARDLVLTALVIVVAIFDGKFRRIPNRIVFPAMLVGLIGHLGWPGELGRAAGATGIVVGFLLLLLPYVAGGMKAGDVKLLMAIGAFTGAWGVVEVLLVTLLFYPVLALFAVVRERKVRLTWLRFRQVLFNFLGLFLPMLKWYAIRLDSQDDSSIPSVTTPFGVALAVGTLLTQYGFSLWS
jgi:prepilin peptidase CpaA